MLKEHRAKLDGVSKTLGNTIDPFLYRDCRLVEDGRLSAIEGVLDLYGQSRGVNDGIESNRHAAGCLKFFQFFGQDLGVTLHIPVGVREVVATIVGGNSACHGDND